MSVNSASLKLSSDFIGMTSNSHSQMDKQISTTSYSEIVHYDLGKFGSSRDPEFDKSESSDEEFDNTPSVLRFDSNAYPHSTLKVLV